MDFVALLIFAAFVTMTVALIARAVRIFEGDRRYDVSVEEDSATRRLGEFTERKAVLMQLIQSTKLDFDTGKISEADRNRTVRRFEREAVRIMKEIDRLRGTDDDRAAAEVALDTYLEEVRGPDADGEGSWSVAARMRHGGRVPTGEGSS